jgi:hypothetical protein
MALIKDQASEYNEYATKKMNSITEHKYFATIRAVDQALATQMDPFNRGFYLHQQDVLSNAYGEVLIAYRHMKGKLFGYIAVRKFEMVVEAKINKEKLPSKDVLEDLINSEIIDVYNAMLILKGWVERGKNSVQSCRAHCFSNGEVPDKDDNKDKEFDN